MKVEMAQEYIHGEFNTYVKPSGKSDTLYGEIIRALSRIGYRYFNDGDKIGIDYGNETCNAAARFLSENTNKEIETLIASMWGNMYFDKDYKKSLDELYIAVASYLKENKDELVTRETEDMFDYEEYEDFHYNDEDDFCYDDDDEEEEWC